LRQNDSPNDFPLPFRLGEFLVQPALNRVSGVDEMAQVEPRVMQVLLCLADSDGEVVSRHALMDMVWTDTIVGEEVLTRAVSELRRIFRDKARSPRYIETIRNHGYRLLVPVVPEAPTGRESEPRRGGQTAAGPDEDYAEDDGLDDDGPLGDGVDDTEVPGRQPAVDRNAAGSLDGGSRETAGRGTARHDTDRPGDDVSQVATHHAPLLSTGTSRTRRMAYLLALVLVLAAGYFLVQTGFWNRPAVVPHAETPYTNYAGLESNPALSPDGTKVAFSWRGRHGDNLDVYIKQQNTEIPLRLTTDPGWDGAPVWSPDGSEIAYINGTARESRIFTVAAIGGPPRQIYSSPTWIQGIDWSPDGRTLALSARGNSDEPFRIHLLDLHTRELSALTSPVESGYADFAPRFSPDGQTVALARYDLANRGDLFVVPRDGGDPRQVTTGLLSIQGLSWSAAGSDLICAAGGAGISSLWRISVADGARSWIPLRADYVRNPTIARAGGALVFEKLTQRIDVVQIRILQREPFRLETSPFITSTRWDFGAHIDRESQRVVFASSRSGHPEIWMCDADGDNPSQLTFFEGLHVSPPRWSPDGRQIAFSANLDGHAVVHLLDAAGGPPRALVGDGYHDAFCGWSRDGAWLYFGSDRSGTWQIARMHPDGAGLETVTSGGGYLAQESQDGHILYFTRPDAPGIWSTPTAGGSEELLIDSLLPQDRSNWVVHADGIYFIFRGDRDNMLCFYEFASAETRLLTGIGHITEGGLSCSPDGQTILLAQTEYLAGDLVLVEDFR